MYQLTQDPNTILRTTDYAYIPVDDANIDYQNYLAWVAEGNTVTAYVPPTLTPAQIVQNEVAALIAGGLTITSTSTPSVNGVYSCDDNSVKNLNACETFILRNNAFFNGSSTQAWQLLNGSFVEIPSVAIFNAITDAIANFIAQITVYSLSNGAIGSLPSNTVTIV